MLTTLALENFKAFGERQVIPLAPITLLFGANSAGKSSVLQSLLLMKQTLAQTESDPTLLLPRGDLVDLGSPRDLVFRHDVTRECEIAAFYWRDWWADTWHGWHVSDLTKPPGRLGVGLRFGPSKDQTLELRSMPYYWQNTDKPAYHLVPTTSPQDVDASKLGYDASWERWEDGYYSRFVRLGGQVRTHPLWEELYQNFTDARLDSYAESIRGSLKYVESSVRATEVPFFGSNRKLDSEQVQQVREILEERVKSLSDYSREKFLRDLATDNSCAVIALRNFLPDADLPVDRGQLEPAQLASRHIDDFRYHSSSGSRGTPDIAGLSVTLGRLLRSALVLQRRFRGLHLRS